MVDHQGRRGVRHLVHGDLYHPAWAHYQSGLELDYAPGMNSVAWNPQGTRIVIAGNFCAMRIIDSTTWRVIQEVYTRAEQGLGGFGPHAIAWNTAGTYFARCCGNGELHIVHADSGRVAQTWCPGIRDLRAVSWNP